MAACKPISAKDIIDACLQAIAEGGENPLFRVFDISKTVRDAKNGTKFANIMCTVKGQTYPQLQIRFKNEVHTGFIPPLDDADVSLMNSNGKGKFVIEKRNKDPTINIQKYKVPVETNEKGDLVGELPEDEKSEYFQLIAFLDTFVRDKITERLKDKTYQVRDAGATDNNPGTTIIPNGRIVPLIQTHISNDAEKNPGGVLYNPIARMSMKFDAKDGSSKGIQFFDHKKPIAVAGKAKPQYEELKFDGQPVTAFNVHKITSSSIVWGVDRRSVCFSKMGASCPSNLQLLMLELRSRNHKLGVDDAISDDEEETAAEQAITEDALADVLQGVQV